MHVRAEGELSAERTAELLLGRDVLPEAVRVQRARGDLLVVVCGARGGARRRSRLRGHGSLQRVVLGS